MKKILPIVFLLLSFFSCKKEYEVIDITKQQEIGAIQLNGSVVLSGTIPEKNIGKLEVYSGFFKNEVGSRILKRSDDFEYSTNITAMPDAVQMHILTNNGNPLCYALSINPIPNQPLRIDARTTAISLLFMHRLLISGDPATSNKIVEKINVAPTFNKLVDEIIALQVSGSLNNFTPNIIPENLPSYKQVLREVLLGLFENFSIEQNGITLSNVNRIGNEVTFTLENKRKRCLSIYAQKYIAGGTTDIDIAISGSEDWQKSELLRTKSFSFVKDFLFGNLYDNLLVSETYEVKKTNAEKILVQCYGLGVDSNSFPSFTSDEFYKGAPALVNTLFSDYAMPIWGLITGYDVKKIELRGRPFNDPISEILSKWTNVLINNDALHSSIAAHAANENYDAIIGELGKSAGVFILDPDNTKLFYQVIKDAFNVKEIKEVGIQGIMKKLNTVVRIVDIAEGSVDITRAIKATFSSTWKTEKIIDITDSKPSVTTLPVTNPSTTSATSGGEVTVNGGQNVTARGVCWSTSPNPTITDDTTINDAGLGTYASTMTGLSSSTTYYVRAYATNAKGTGYGAPKSFTTLISGGIYNGSMVLNSQHQIDSVGALNFTQITGTLKISSGNNVTNLSPLSSIQSVGGQLSIVDCDSLTTLNGLALYTVGEIELLYNNNLTHIDALTSLTTCSNSISIEFNNLLQQINGISNISGTLNSKLRIRDNNSLLNIDGLLGLTQVNGEVAITANPLITNIDGLLNITSVGSLSGNLVVSQNPALTNLDGLSSITNVSQNIFFNNNTSLTDLCGIRPYLQLNTFSGTYNVSGNANNPSKQDIINGNCN